MSAVRMAGGEVCHLSIDKWAHPDPLQRIEEGARCTWFVPSSTPIATRKQWIAGTLRPAGAIVIDDGAVRALMGGKSLLPAGATRPIGRFEPGDNASIIGPDAPEGAPGLFGYSGAPPAPLLPPQAPHP